MFSADSQLDAQLRDVSLPDGLLGRLLALPLAGDEGIDGLICEVAIPPGLVERLQAVPLADDEGLDEALRDVPLPADLAASCRHYARRHLARHAGRRAMDRVARISRVAMAASLIVAVTLSLGGAMLLSLVLNGSNDWLPVPQVTQENLPPGTPAETRSMAGARSEAGTTSPVENHLETSWGTPSDPSDDLYAGSALGDDSGFAATSPQDRRASQPGDDRRDIALAEIEPSAGLPSRDLAASATLPRGADPLALSSVALGYPPNSWDDLPELPTRVPNLVPHGVDWPLEPGANRPFLVKWGFHPFVSPSADPRLQTCPVPLAVEPSSYELARRYLERNEWPPADRIRTEEFLAAVDYKFPKPKHQALGLTVAGGPSPISGEGFCLLQVGVQARQTNHAQHPPLHLVLLIDASTSMRWGSRMEIVRRALHDLPGIIGAEDRISLVTFNQAAHVLVENLGHDALPPVAAAVDSLSAEGATNIIAGLREAYGVARPALGAGRPAVRVVLLSDGLLDLEPATAQKIEQQVAQAAAEKIPLDAIDLGQQKEADPQMAALASAGRGTVHRAISAKQVRWALREIVTGRPQVVARAARLQVNFNPHSVLEYRLVGHESGDWGSLLPGPLEADFREGQAATALFEVRLVPNGPHDLGSAELTWYAPDGERTLAGKTALSARLKLDRKQFAPSLSSSAASLQQAAVVAYTVEVLRHSPFIFQRRPGLSMPAALYRAVELSGQIDGQLQQLPAFGEFVALIRQEMKAHPAKRSVKDYN